ncbi:MAG: hypothetical protein L5656_05375 [Thermanaeromonas sp.]|nr:hypothetical protein [Thermanaeromonas sp.]
MVILERASMSLEHLPEIRFVLPPYRHSVVSGDIFFVGDRDVFFLVVASRRDYIERYWEDRFSEPPIHLTQESNKPQIVLGVISCVGEELNRRLDEFTTAVETAIRASGTQNATEVDFKWKEIQPETPKLAKIRGEAASREIRFEEPKLELNYLNVVENFTDGANRELLIEISQAGFVLERDLLGRKRRDSDKVQAILEKLRQDGLVKADYVLECKKERKIITRLRTQDQINVPEVAELTCPYCSSSFSQEKLSIGYSLSELGHRMLQGSHWMTVLVTGLLVKLGVPQGSILWHVSEAGGEIDILAEVMESLWIFELKDREFGAGDAYALNYRRVIYGADKTVVVTTERISPDAKRVLEGVQTEYRRYGRRTNNLVYIEGLEQAEEILTKEISLERLRYARRWLVPLEELSGYNIGKILSVRFEKELSTQQ